MTAAELEFVTTLVLPYDQLRTLQNGGAEVHLYRNVITDTMQVGKRIDVSGQQAFALREAKLLRTIAHPHLVPVVDVAVVPGYPSPMRVIEMVMPYYKRGSFCEVMLNTGLRFSVGDAVRLTQQALRGLGELHDVRGILHRDMKSPNVFLTDDDQLRVGDLGACIDLDDNGEAEPYPSLQPTTPPETYVTQKVNRSYDIFGVGVILFELLNGPLPYPFDEVRNEKRLRKGMLVPSDENLRCGPHVAPQLRRIVRKAMARDPSRRFPDVAAMRSALSSAEYIDWRPAVRDPEVIRWEGRLATRPDREFQVEASKSRRRGAWVLVARQRLTSWRRFREDMIVADPEGSDATAFFDQVLSESLKP